MTFGFPHLRWLLLLVPALAVLVWWSWRMRRQAMAQFVGSRLLEALTVGLSPVRRKIRIALLLSAFALILFSLTRPQWGFDLEEARQRGLDIVVAIDTSKSMLAEDIKPNRLTRAKLAALDLMRLAKSDRLGLVAFAGTAFLQCPLSLDEEAYRQSVEALDTAIIPQGGTAITEAIQTALSAFKEKTDNHKILVLFTDGEDNETGNSALEAARDAAKDGLRIFTIGVGTRPGEVLSTSDPYGNRVFIKDPEGNVVKSRLNEPLLQEISKETQGFYLPLVGAQTMDILYERGLAPLPKADFASKTMRQVHERYQWFLGFGILLLIAEMLFPERKRAVPSRKAPQAVTIASVLLVTFAISASASTGDALDNYNRGKYGRARAEYERLAKKSPNDARLQYNAGAAAFQDGDYDAAHQHFSSSLTSPDLKLQASSYYNLGNTLFRQGEKSGDAKEKQSSWEQAIHHYENALKLQPQDEDAKANMEVVKQKLEELKKQQQQQQQQQNQQNKNDDKKDENKDQQQQQQDQKKQDEQKKDEQQKQDSKKDQQQQQQSGKDKKEDQQQQQQQQNQQQDQSKPDEKQGQDQLSAQDQRGKEPDAAAQAAQYGRVMQMTPQQAMQLLEAQKAEEKAMIFVPQNVKTNKQNNRLLKDW